MPPLGAVGFTDAAEAGIASEITIFPTRGRPRCHRDASSCANRVLALGARDAWADESSLSASALRALAQLETHPAETWVGAERGRAGRATKRPGPLSLPLRVRLVATRTAMAAGVRPRRVARSAYPSLARSISAVSVTRLQWSRSVEWLARLNPKVQKLRCSGPIGSPRWVRADTCPDSVKLIAVGCAEMGRNEIRMSSASRARSGSESVTIRSPAYWSLLGLIIERADYGYGLVQRFRRAYGDALPVSSDSHVYGGLAALERSGLIEVHTSRGGRQPTPRYRATPYGVRAYADWLMSRIRVERLRSRLFARQLAALAREPELGFEVIEQYERACLEEEGSGALGCVASSASESLALALPAEQARLAAQAELPWISYARERFTTLLDQRSDKVGD